MFEKNTNFLNKSRGHWKGDNSTYQSQQRSHSYPVRKVSGKIKHFLNGGIKTRHQRHITAKESKCENWQILKLFWWQILSTTALLLSLRMLLLLSLLTDIPFSMGRKLYAVGLKGWRDHSQRKEILFPTDIDSISKEREFHLWGIQIMSLLRTATWLLPVEHPARPQCSVYSLQKSTSAKAINKSRFCVKNAFVIKNMEPGGSYKGQAILKSSFIIGKVADPKSALNTILRFWVAFSTICGQTSIRSKCLKTRNNYEKFGKIIHFDGFSWRLLPFVLSIVVAPSSCSKYQFDNFYYSAID